MVSNAQEQMEGGRKGNISFFAKERNSFKIEKPFVQSVPIKSNMKTLYALLVIRYTILPTMYIF